MFSEKLNLNNIISLIFLIFILNLTMTCVNSDNSDNNSKTKIYKSLFEHRIHLRHQPNQRNKTIYKKRTSNINNNNNNNNHKYNGKRYLAYIIIQEDILLHKLCECKFYKNCLNQERIILTRKNKCPNRFTCCVFNDVVS